MHRIDSSTATADHKFTLGDPANQVPATVITADIMNAFQEELVQVVDDAGASLNKADNTQVSTAITTRINAAINALNSALTNTINGVNSALSSSINQHAPSGTIITYAGNTAPDGWLECDGSLVNRATRSALFNAIGTIYGEGDGSTTFALPDLRGQFVRGWDHGKGIDTDRQFGSSQTDANKSHNHGGTTGNDSPDHTHSSHTTASGAMGTQSTGTEPIYDTPAQTGGASTRHTHSISSDGGTEARPKNIAMMYCIKF